MDKKFGLERRADGFTLPLIEAEAREGRVVKAVEALSFRLRPRLQAPQIRVGERKLHQWVNYMHRV